MKNFLHLVKNIPPDGTKIQADVEDILDGKATDSFEESYIRLN